MASLSFKTGVTEFEKTSTEYDVVPVRAVMGADAIRPVDAFRALRVAGEPSFILESESPEAGASRYAYVCPSAERVVRTGASEPLGDIDPVTALRSQIALLTVPSMNDLPELVTGAFGYMAYEAIKHFEPSVGELPNDPTGSPVSAFIFPRELLVFDHVSGELHIIVFASVDDEYDEVAERISKIGATLDAKINHSSDCAQPQPLINDPVIDQPHAPPTPISTEYPTMVREARKAIIDGELIQVVLGQRIEVRTAADSLAIYEQLAALNPSPYMYLFDLGDMQLIGASPELMLRSTGGIASVHPIAGTRSRGATREKDLRKETALLSDEKESAEHVMLVDLARNDLGRVCEPGTVKVSSFKHIERYSHVMHLVSRVEGRLAKGNDGIEAFKAGFPIGTLSGAPKIRSIQLIAELEHEGRGPYCGGIGWFGANGDVDTGTVIRSIVLRDQTAHVQGGAGIVFDSDPDHENLESLQKAKAPLLAIARAEAMQDIRWRSSENIPLESEPTATMPINGE